MTEPYLTIGELRAAAAGKGGGWGHGKPALFPDKAPKIVYLTDWTKARLIMLAKNAKVSQSDFLEVLIRRYGIRTGSDILEATGKPDDEHDLALGDGPAV